MSKLKKTKSFTVQGEWFPETETSLKAEMRLFCSCMRWVFNKLLEGKTRNELKKQAQVLFGLNSRYCDDAILQAQAIISSQKELLSAEIKTTERKLARAKKKLKHAEKKLNKNQADEKLGRLVNGRKLRVKKLTTKLAELSIHKENGTIPKIIFGGRSLWKKVCRGEVSNKEWRNARQNRLYARGDETKQGNPNIRIAYQDGNFYLAVGISHLVDSGMQAPRINGRLWIPHKYQVKIWDLLLSGNAYTIELIRKGGRYRAHITFEPETPKTIPNTGYLGIDTNPDGVALANVNEHGNVIPWPEDFVVPYPKALHKHVLSEAEGSKGEFQVIKHKNGFMYLKIPELPYSRSHRRTYLIGVLAKVVVDIAKSLSRVSNEERKLSERSSLSLNRAIAVENLKFNKDRLDTNKRFNRMASNFPYEKMLTAIHSRAHKEGVAVTKVWPAHTSTIGYWKYQQKHGVTTHHAAAYVIARRALYIKERVTKELRQKACLEFRVSNEERKLRENLVRDLPLPMEGKGMPTKVKQLFERLDQKFLTHNDLTRYEQERFGTIWSDFKKLYLFGRLSPVKSAQ